MKRKVTNPNVYRPCGRCVSGMVLVERDGARVAVRCQCWLNWKAGKQTEVDRKQQAAGK